jgi:glycosyltransferase involved in cell wall biosynthesis
LIKSNHTKGVSILVPAFNEANTIEYNVKLITFSRISLEVVVINDGKAR